MFEKSRGGTAARSLQMNSILSREPFASLNLRTIDDARQKRKQDQSCRIAQGEKLMADEACWDASEREKT